MSTNNYKSLPDLSNEFILDALNNSRSFEELSKKLNCYKKNSNTRKRHIFHYLNLIGIYEMTYEQLKENYNKHNRKDRYCLKCGKKLTILQMRTNNKFCSNSCANSYNRTGFKMNNEIKSNIREGLINSPKYKENLLIIREQKKQRDEEKRLLKIEQKKQREIIKLLKREENILKKSNCKICGSLLIDGKCENDFCNKHKRTNFDKLSKYFGFDISKYGTIEVEFEFNRIRNILYNLYWNEHMSALLMEKIFNLPNSSMYSYFKLFDIPSKTLAYASKESILEKRSKIHMLYHLKWRYDSHTTWDNKKVNLRSINEILYAKHLDELKILYEVETLRIKYFDSQKEDYRFAIPDFYLPKTNTIVEIKSAFTLDVINMKDKIKEYENLGYNFKLIFEFKEMTLDEILESDMYEYDINKNILKRVYKKKERLKIKGYWINKNGIIRKCFNWDVLKLYLNDGWTLGTGNHKKMAGISKVVRLNENGFLEYKIIDRSELNDYLNNGWFKGKTTKYKILEILKEVK